MSDKSHAVKAPVFSVVMPAYNAEAKIAESIESVLGQTLPDWELVIVDDCSTDNTAEVCAGFRDSRIRLLSTPQNLNAAGARNLALEHATGQFVAFLDSDDFAAPNRLQRQLEFFRTNPEVGVCGTYVETFGGAGAEEPGSIKYPCSDGAIKATMFFYDPFVTSSVSARMSVLRGLSSPVFRRDYAPAEDYDLWARLLDKTEFANLPEILNRYRIHGGQLTCTQSGPMRRQIKAVWGDLLSLIGLRPTEFQLSLHDAIVYEGQHDVAQLPSIRDWLETVLRAGQKHSFLPQAEWAKAFGFQWYVCCKRTRPRSLRVWNMYRASPLYRYFFSRRQKFAFFRSSVAGTLGRTCVNA